MTRLTLLPIIAMIPLLAACEARIGKDEPAAERKTADSAGKGEAEAGQFSIDAPGFAMKLNIPDSISERADVDSDSGILYPGSKLSGMHVSARDREGEGNRVELRFTSGDAPSKVAAWYRDPARAADFSVGSASERAGVISIAGTEKEDGDPFELSLSPRGGGTEGLLRLHDRS